MVPNPILQSSIHTGGDPPSTSHAATVILPAHKNTVTAPYAQINNSVAAGRRLLKDIPVTTTDIPTLCQKHGELLEDEKQHFSLLQQTHLTGGDVHELQRLAANIHQVYLQGMYDRTSLAVVPPNPTKAMQVLLETIRRIDADPKLDSNQILPELYYSLAKMMMAISKRLQADSQQAKNMQKAAMAYYEKSDTIPGSAFALFVHQFGGNLETPEGRKQFQNGVDDLLFPKKDKAYYAGKYFKERTEASKANEPLCAIFQDLSTKYFKEVRGDASYRGEKAKAYMAKHIMSQARDMHGKAQTAESDSAQKSFCKRALDKIRQVYELIFGNSSRKQVFPNKNLGANSYAVLADACAMDYALTGYDPIRIDALQYQEAASALGMPNRGVEAEATSYHASLIANATPQLLAVIAPKMEGASTEAQQALMDRAVGDADRFEGVLLYLIEQGSEESLETIAATDNLPPKVMDALLTKINSNPRKFEKAVVQCVQQGHAEALLNTPPCDNPQAVVDRLAAYPPLIRDDLLLVVLATNNEPWIMQQILERNWVEEPKVKNELVTIFHHAATSGNIKIIQMLLDVDMTDFLEVLLASPDTAGDTALHLAVREGHAEIVECLVRGGADIHNWSATGSSALASAVRHKNPEVLKRLFSNGKPFDLQRGYHALTLAIRSTELQMLACLIEEGGLDVNCCMDGEGNPTILHYAAKWAEADTIAWLIGHGAKIDAVDDRGQTPLLYAAFSDDENIDKAADRVEVLLRKGADIDAGRPYGFTVLHTAVIHERIDIVKMLLEKGAKADTISNEGDTALCTAILIGNSPEGIGIIEMLLQKNPGLLNMPNKNGQMPLHYAIWRNQSDIIKILLKHDADPLARDEVGKTPLIYAVLSRNMEIIEMLLQKIPATVNMPNGSGRMPLHYAISNNQSDVIKMLLEHGADPLARDEFGKTPLANAVSSRNIEIIEMLLQKIPATVNMPREDGVTILHLAIQQALAGKHTATTCKDIEVIQVLLEHGGENVDATSSDGVTILHLAAELGNTAVAQMLLERGAKVDAVDNSGLTPLHIASMCGNTDIAKMLQGRGAKIDTTCKSEMYPDPMAELGMCKTIFSDKHALEEHLTQEFIHNCFFENKTATLVKTLLKNIPDDISDFLKKQQLNSSAWKVILKSNTKEDTELLEGLRINAVTDAKSLFIGDYVQKHGCEEFNMQQFAMDFLDEFSCCCVLSHQTQHRAFFKAHFDLGLESSSDLVGAVETLKADEKSSDLYENLRKLALCATMSAATCQMRIIKVYTEDGSEVVYSDGQQPGQASVNGPPASYVISSFNESVGHYSLDLATPWVGQAREYCKLVLDHPVFSGKIVQGVTYNRQKRVLEEIFRLAHRGHPLSSTMPSIDDFKRIISHMVNPEKCLAISTLKVEEYTDIFLADTEALQGDIS